MIIAIMQASLFVAIVVLLLHSSGHAAFGASSSSSSSLPGAPASSFATARVIPAATPPTTTTDGSSIPISSATVVGVEECIRRAKEEHDVQFAEGAAVFGVSGGSNSGGKGGLHDLAISSDENAADTPTTNAQTPTKEWSDEDFIPHNVGIGNAGPTEHLLTNGHVIHQTVNPVLSPTECEYWIETAREAIAAGLAAEAAEASSSSSDDGKPRRERSRFSDRTNSELNEARLSSLPPHAVDKLRKLLKDKLYPLLESRYGVTKLTVYDGLILGSIAPTVPQPVHRDASLLTLNIALSPRDGFTEGGTYVEGLKSGTPLIVDQGVALCHSSGVMHAGNGIRTGERWQMVLFCLARDEPQVARRCHAVGLDAIADGDFNGAMAAFDAGLTAAPADHLLHMGRGQVHDARGNAKGAFDCLNEASKCYPLNYKAGIAMGKMLLAARRPRAALRRLDEVLSNLDDADQQDEAFLPLKAAAWEARVTAARCAMLCAEYEAAKMDGTRQWTKERLPVAINRLHVSIEAAPQDGRLHGLLARAEELLKEANQT